jgi:hypothetical protein
MIDRLNQALTDYQFKWERLLAGRAKPAFFASLKQTAVGWKTVDRAEYDQIFAELYDMCDVINSAWVGERWVTTMHLKSTVLTGDIEVVKLMQRRPGSKDAVGLDHVDFYSPEVARAENVLQGESDLRWTHERSGPTTWISVWFDNTEAKLRMHTVVDSCIRELQQVNVRIKDQD